MDKREQQIAIAEACGWKKLLGVPSSIGVTTQWEHPDEKMRWTELPEYTNDLNAMHKAEKTLESTGEYSQREFYASILGDITRNDNGRGWKPLCNDDCFPILHATAAQRAEAFLKTLNLWKEKS